MVSKWFLRRHPEIWDSIEKKSKAAIVRDRKVLASLLEEKPRFWRGLVKKVESNIRRLEADLERLEVVRGEFE